tara:strand:- start:2214 stop:3197 length:984 start_codon:yes stop_codon:yes gene_type:complete
MNTKKEVFSTILFKDEDSGENHWSENYINVLEILIRSLCIFSTRKIVVFSNSKLPFDYPNMEVINLEEKRNLPSPNRFRQVGGSGVDSFTDFSDDFAASFWLSKFELNLKLFEMGYEKVAWVDSDVIATKYIDRIWEKNIEHLKYPLLRKHTYQSVFMWKNGKKVNLLSEECMEFVGAKNRLPWHAFGCISLSHSNSFDFWSESVDLYKKCLSENIFMPVNGETFMNAMLSKYNASTYLSDDLGSIDLNPNLQFRDYAYLNFCEFFKKSLAIPFWKKEHGNIFFNEKDEWFAVPEDKENIFFIHGVKKTEVAESLFQKYINNIVFIH